MSAARRVVLTGASGGLGAEGAARRVVLTGASGGLGAEGAARRVVLTGASGGLGAEMAALLAARGDHVVLVGRRADALERLAARTDGAPFPCDLARADEVDRLLAAWPEADVLVHAAGFAAVGPVAAADWAGQRDMLAVHATATVRLCQHYVRGMVARRRGRVLTVASSMARAFRPGWATYAASKAFVLQFTRALALEVAGAGDVRVACLLPGPIATGFRAAARLGPRRREADPRAVARHGLELMEAGALSGGPGDGWRRLVAALVPEALWARLARRGTPA